MRSDPSFRRLERFRRNCETVTDNDADRAVNLLVAAFPGATKVDPQPAAEVDSDQWRRADNGQLAHRCQVCKSVLTCRRHGGRWTCSFCRPEEEVA
jgi:hypothetical protein